jgi:hypothetical protein
LLACILDSGNSKKTAVLTGNCYAEMINIDEACTGINS